MEPFDILPFFCSTAARRAAFSRRRRSLSSLSIILALSDSSCLSVLKRLSLYVLAMPRNLFGIAALFRKMIVRAYSNLFSDIDIIKYTRYPLLEEPHFSKFIPRNRVGLLLYFFLSLIHI